MSSVKTPRIRITVDDEPALTVEQAAARKGVQPKTMAGELTRYKASIRPVAELDGRKKLYREQDIDEWWDNRPGKGAPGVPKPHKAGTPARAPRRAKGE